MTEKKTEKKKWSKGQCILVICIIGPLETGLFWWMGSKGWLAIDLIFWPVMFFAALFYKENSN